ncbi:hypothetical protein F5Y16DRAFT_348496 [Xylariaceae sp. FL0255]|nr:hypothetical protein F5Y16DRAFT_348496 [Xylariaceae sp. FL0255]
MDPQIHEWRKSIQQDLGHEETLSIADVFHSCSDLWLSLTRCLSQQDLVKKSTIRKLESGHSYLCLWADGYGVSSGRFERELQKSQRAGDLTIRLLQSICRKIIRELVPIMTSINASKTPSDLPLRAAELALASERLAVLVQGDNDSDFSNSSDDESERSSTPAVSDQLLESIADDLRTDCQCLMELGSRFEEQVTNPITVEAVVEAKTSTTWKPADHFAARILRLYPLCEKDLATRLGGLCWVKLRNLLSNKTPSTSKSTENSAVAESLEGQSVDLESTSADPTTKGSIFKDSGLGTASQTSKNDNAVDPEIHPYRCKVEGCKNAEFFSVARLLRHQREAHVMHGHGDKPYLCSYEGCERSIIGYGFPRQWNLREHMRRFHNDKDTSFPTSPRPLSPSFGGNMAAATQTVSDDKSNTGIQVGAPSKVRVFTCKFCQKQIRLTTEAAWREHLLSDINLYICPKVGCSNVAFEERSHFMAHIGFGHLLPLPSSSFEPYLPKYGHYGCPICGENVIDKDPVGQHYLGQHIIKHMEHIALVIIAQQTDLGIKDPETTKSNISATSTPLPQEKEKSSTTGPQTMKTVSCVRCRRRDIKCDKQVRFLFIIDAYEMRLLYPTTSLNSCLLH